MACVVRIRIHISSVRRVGRAWDRASHQARTTEARSSRRGKLIWRAWFANDTKTLQKLVPSDAIVISAGEERWKTQAEVFQSASEFQNRRWRA
jgi:hypothetical protein